MFNYIVYYPHSYRPLAVGQTERGGTGKGGNTISSTFLKFWHLGNKARPRGVSVTLELSLWKIDSARGKYTLRHGEFSAILSDSCSCMFLLCFFDLKVYTYFLKLFWSETVSPNRATKNVSSWELGELKIHVFAMFSQLLGLPGLQKQGFIKNLLFIFKHFSFFF